MATTRRRSAFAFTHRKSTRKSKDKNGCVLCKRSNEDELDFGGLLSTKVLRAHYFCLLLSETINQSGKDSQGIWGFLNSDIIREVDGSKNKQCHYCGESGATLGCARKNCKRKFHLPCGLMNRTQHDFEKFISYCHAHRKPCNIPSKLRQRVGEFKCLICLENYNPRTVNIEQLVWADCCKKDVILHIACVKKLALSAGYFTKCPACNNNKEFINTVKKLGVFVPERDASWEIGRNAFGDLLYRHDRCDMEKCVCPKGRNYKHNSGNWKLILCELCGSFGTHKACANVTENFICKTCNINGATNCVNSSNNLPNSNDDNLPEENDAQSSEAISFLNLNIDSVRPANQQLCNDVSDSDSEVICISSDSDDHFSEREPDSPPPEPTLPKYSVCSSDSKKRKIDDSVNYSSLPRVAKKKTVYPQSRIRRYEQQQVARKSTGGNRIYCNLWPRKTEPNQDVKDTKLGTNGGDLKFSNIVDAKSKDEKLNEDLKTGNISPLTNMSYDNSESGDSKNIRSIKHIINSNLESANCLQFFCNGPLILQCSSQMGAVEIDNNNEVEIANVPDDLKAQKNVSFANPKSTGIIIIDDSDDENASEIKITDVRSVTGNENAENNLDEKERLNEKYC